VTVNGLRCPPVITVGPPQMRDVLQLELGYKKNLVAGQNRSYRHKCQRKRHTHTGIRLEREREREDRPSLTVSDVSECAVDRR